LVWARKGEGPVPVFPALSDDRETGLALSGNPTRIRILGDRNLYQVHDIPMVQDWARAWERFFDPILFYEEVFQKGQTRAELTLKGVKFPAGTPFVDISTATTTGPDLEPVDPEQMVSRQLAKASALEMTVQEYADLVGDESFLDYRKFAGRSRLDMPAVLYLRQILFRAFRFSEDFGIVNQVGQFIPLPSLEISSKMIAKVSHDPVSGEMDWDPTENADGSGYGIVQGYQVGKDLFKTIKPERFRPDQWTDAQRVWEHVEFHIDDSGDEDSRFILFDEPVIKSADLVDLVDGYAVFKAKPTFSVPEGGAKFVGQLGRAQEGLGVGAERVKPQLLGPLVGHVEIGAVAAVTGAEADGRPVAGLVTGAGISLRIGETLGQERAVAEVLAPLIGQGAQGGGEGLAGEIGSGALGGEQEAAAVLHEEFEALDALGGAPTDPAVAILEGVGGRPPDQEGDGLAVALDDLALVIPDGAARAEGVPGSEVWVEGGDLVGRGHAHGEGGRGRGAGLGGVGACGRGRSPANVGEQTFRPASSRNFTPCRSMTCLPETIGPVGASGMVSFGVAAPLCDGYRDAHEIPGFDRAGRRRRVCCRMPVAAGLHFPGKNPRRSGGQHP
jgi:hypothetical protein